MKQQVCGFALVGQSQALVNTETVLFVYDGEAKSVVVYGLLKQGVRANNNMDRPVRKAFQNVVSDSAFFPSRQDGEMQSCGAGEGRLGRGVRWLNVGRIVGCVYR